MQTLTARINVVGVRSDARQGGHVTWVVETPSSAPGPNKKATMAFHSLSLGVDCEQYEKSGASCITHATELGLELEKVITQPSVESA